MISANNHRVHNQLETSRISPEPPALSEVKYQHVDIEANKKDCETNEENNCIIGVDFFDGQESLTLDVHISISKKGTTISCRCFRVFIRSQNEIQH